MLLAEAKRKREAAKAYMPKTQPKTQPKPTPMVNQVSEKPTAKRGRPKKNES